MWMLQNTQIFLSKYLYSFSLARSRAGCLKWDFVGFLKCKLKRVLVAANCRPGVKPLTSWQPPLVSQKCLCSTRSNSSTQGDLGEVSIIIFGMSQTWNFVKNFTPSDFQAKHFTPSISPNFHSFSDRNTKKWVKKENFTPLTKILHCRRHWQIPTLDEVVMEHIK